MPPTPLRISRMQAETQEPSTVTSTSSAALLTKYSPGRTFTIQLELAESKKRRVATAASAASSAAILLDCLAVAAPLTLPSGKRCARQAAGRDATRSAI